MNPRQKWILAGVNGGENNSISPVFPQSPGWKPDGLRRRDAK